jgi:hypothetical protein
MSKNFLGWYNETEQMATHLTWLKDVGAREESNNVAVSLPSKHGSVFLANPQVRHVPG